MDINVFAHSQIYTDKIETDLDLWRKGRLKKCHLLLYNFTASKLSD